jgi:hypothetical protein
MQASQKICFDQQRLFFNDFLYHHVNAARQTGAGSALEGPAARQAGRKNPRWS